MTRRSICGKLGCFRLVRDHKRVCHAPNWISSAALVESGTVGSNVSFVPPRNSGIRVMPKVQWGTHLCVLYDSKEDLLDTGVGWFEAGLADNELCLWIVSDPITEDDALQALHEGIAGFEKYHRKGQFQFRDTHRWCDLDRLGLQKVIGQFHDNMKEALEKGYSGLRVNGNTFWSGSNRWQEFQEFELALNQSLAGEKIVLLCTYPLRTASALEVLDVVEAHHSAIIRRNKDWEFLETPELKAAKQEIRRLRGALDILSKDFPGHELLTPREKMALSQIVSGASSKEAARTLGVSPRTIEFHRGNILKKLGARNTADMLRRVLAE
jgi:DNA-binding CsgD family transcriptional regulator